MTPVVHAVRPTSTWPTTVADRDIGDGEYDVIADGGRRLSYSGVEKV